jgi:hypothetical protein
MWDSIINLTALKKDLSEKREKNATKANNGIL